MATVLRVEDRLINLPNRPASGHGCPTFMSALISERPKLLLIVFLRIVRHSTNGLVPNAMLLEQLLQAVNRELDERKAALELGNSLSQSLIRVSFETCLACEQIDLVLDQDLSGQQPVPKAPVEPHYSLEFQFQVLGDHGQ